MDNLAIPTKEARRTAGESYKALKESIDNIDTPFADIEVENFEERIKLPIEILKMMADMLKAMSQNKVISFVPIAAEVTTQMAAEILNCSRPHVVALLESGKIPFTKIGRHRRIKLEDLMVFKKAQHQRSKELLIEIMKEDEESGLYDT